jgi:drug/metabolite transporter (DMT)-like permease
MNLIPLLILAMVFWGISWPIGKLVSSEANAAVIIFWRNLLTTITFLPLLYIFRKSYNFSKKGIIIGLFGSILMTFYNFLFFLGLQNGTSGLGGVLVTTTNPLFNFLLLRILGKYKIQKFEKFALFIGFLGGISTLQIWNINPSNLLEGGNIIFLFASFTWAILSIQSSSSKDFIHPIFYSFVVYLLSTIFTYFLSIPYGNTDIETKTTEFWLEMIYLSSISTGFGTTIYFIASSKLGSEVSSVYLFLVPISAVIGAFAILGEIPNGFTIFGGILSILAIRLLHIVQKKKKLNTIEPI